MTQINFLKIVAGCLTAILFVELVNFICMEFNLIFGSLVFYCCLIALVIFIVNEERTVKGGEKKNATKKR